MDLQVTCITKPDRDNRHEAITHLGGFGWYWTVGQVIYAIEHRTHRFHTSVGGRRADVGVVNGPRGKYVRTYANGKWNDNLLALPRCR